MAIVIDNPELEERVRAAAARTGRTVEQFVAQSLEAATPRPRFTEAEWQERLARIHAIQEEVKRELVLDGRTDEEIIGYDENGLPR